MDLATWFTRYRPYLAIVTAIAALIAFMPGSDGDDLASVDSTGAPLFEPGSTVDTVDGDGETITTEAGAEGGVVSGNGGGGGGSAVVDGPSGGGENAPGAVSQQAQSANCDPATGRIQVPTIYAPPCVPAFAGDNGGSTYQGVTGDTIKVVYFIADESPATSAALTADHSASCSRTGTGSKFHGRETPPERSYGLNVIPSLAIWRWACSQRRSSSVLPNPSSSARKRDQ